MTRMLPLLLVALIGCADGDEHDHDHDHDHDTDDLNLTREAMSDGGTWMVSYEPSTDPIALSENFSLTVTVDEGPTEGVELAWDATMPAHGHGMNTEATVTDNGDGTWTVDGMLFHMAGHWEMAGDLTDGETTETVIFDVEL